MDLIRRQIGGGVRSGAKGIIGRAIGKEGGPDALGTFRLIVFYVKGRKLVIGRRQDIADQLNGLRFHLGPFGVRQIGWFCALKWPVKSRLFCRAGHCTVNCPFKRAHGIARLNKTLCNRLFCNGDDVRIHLWKLGEAGQIAAIIACGEQRDVIAKTGKALIRVFIRREQHCSLTKAVALNLLGQDAGQHALIRPLCIRQIRFWDRRQTVEQPLRLLCGLVLRCKADVR